MNKIVLLDTITILAAFLGLILILFRWKKTKYQLLSLLVGFYLILSILFESLMFIDWAGLTHDFESFEDLAGATLPILWVIVFYMLIEKVNVRKLEKSKESLKHVIQGANLGLWDWNINTGQLVFNERWAEMIGYKTDEIIPAFSSWESMVHPDDFEDAMNRLNEHLTQKIPYYEAEFRMRHKNGTWRWISARGKIVERDENDLSVRATGIHLDITDKKQMENELKQTNEEYLALNEELSESLERIQQINTELEEAKEKAEESDRLKTAFLGNMSHEVRTPMNGILGFIDLLKAPDLKSEKRNEYIKIIEACGTRLLNIINDLIDISKIEEGLIELHLRDISVYGLIDELYRFYEPLAKDKGIRLDFQNKLAQNDCIIQVDSDRISQVLRNLIDNAIKFTQSGQVSFGYSKKETGVEIFVRDTGVGISHEMINVIFERFRQADTSMSRGYEGSGLGLTISKAFVEMHGGKIWAESVIGQGSTFYFTLPDTSKKNESFYTFNNIKTSTSLELNNIKILIVEDDEIAFLLLKEILDQKGLMVIHAKDGIEAIEIVNVNPDIALILMDVKMPIMNGLEATKQIKAKFPYIPIIAQTAYALVKDKQEILQAGCDNYISKPIDREQLTLMLSKYIGFSNTIK